jgi:hypothetical protein
VRLTGHPSFAIGMFEQINHIGVRVRIDGPTECLFPTVDRETTFYVVLLWQAAWTNEQYRSVCSYHNHSMDNSILAT